MLPLLLIAVADIALRYRMAGTWGGLEWLLYGISLLYAYAWLALLRQVGLRMSLPRRRRVALLALAGGLSAFALVSHGVHYLYFGTHPTVINVGYLLEEPAEGWLMLRDAANASVLAGLLMAWLLSALAWRITLSGARRRLGWPGLAGLAGFIVLLTPALYLNVPMSPGNVLPSVNLALTSARAIAAAQETQGTVRRLQVAQRIELPAQPHKQPVNVLLIVSESLRRHNTGFSGYGRETTPAQSALFTRYPARTVRFDHFYSNSTTTSESVPSMLTGVHPSQDYRLLHRMPLLYQYGEMFWDTRSFLLAAHAYDVANYRFFFDSPQLDRLYYQEMSGHPAYNSVGMDDRYVVEAFEAEMAALAPEQRFFGVLHLNGTHYPYNVPPAFRQWGGGTPLDDYDNAILYQDHNIGRVLERLRADGRLDNTVVIMTSDHGEGFGEHGINGHRSGFFEEMLNVPLWMLLPSELAGRYGAVLRENAALPASNVDLAPTLIDLLGLDAVPVVAEVVATLRGSSLVRPLPPGRTILAQNGDQATAAAEGFAVIQGQRRFLHHRIYARMHTQLFDLDTDPAQQVNLWGDLSPAERQALLDVLMHVQPIRRIVASLTAETQ